MLIVNLDVMLARRKMSVTELAQRVGITLANISILKNGKALQANMDLRARFSDFIFGQNRPEFHPSCRYPISERD